MIAISKLCRRSNLTCVLQIKLKCTKYNNISERILPNLLSTPSSDHPCKPLRFQSQAALNRCRHCLWLGESPDDVLTLSVRKSWPRLYIRCTIKFSTRVVILYGSVSRENMFCCKHSVKLSFQAGLLTVGIHRNLELLVSIHGEKIMNLYPQSFP